MSIENIVTPYVLPEPICSSDSVWYRENDNLSVSDVLDAKAALTHTHSEYSSASHTHAEYAPLVHEHSGYASSTHEHTDYAASEHTHTGFAVEDHTHTGFAAENHTHTGFAAEGHAHAELMPLTMLQMLGISESGGLQLDYGTGDTRNILDGARGLGIGFHAVYAGIGVPGNPTTITAYRHITYFSHANASGVATNGMVLSFDTAGSIYSNYLAGGVWQGWKTIYEVSPAPLWAPNNGTGGYYPTAGHTITPSKKLSECKNGWLLLWSDYDTSTGTAGDYDFVSSFIPKIRPNGANWSGQSFLCQVPGLLSSESPYGEATYVKGLIVYDDKITGNAANNQAGRNDVILRAVYEF